MRAQLWGILLRTILCQSLTSPCKCEPSMGFFASKLERLPVTRRRFRVRGAEAGSVWKEFDTRLPLKLNANSEPTQERQQKSVVLTARSTGVGRLRLNSLSVI